MTNQIQDENYYYKRALMALIIPPAQAWFGSLFLKQAFTIFAIRAGLEMPELTGEGCAVAGGTILYTMALYYWTAPQPIKAEEPKPQLRRLNSDLPTERIIVHMPTGSSTYSQRILHHPAQITENTNQTFRTMMATIAHGVIDDKKSLAYRNWINYTLRDNKPFSRDEYDALRQIMIDYDWVYKTPGGQIRITEIGWGALEHYHRYTAQIERPPSDPINLQRLVKKFSLMHARTNAREDGGGG